MQLKVCARSSFVCASLVVQLLQALRSHPIIGKWEASFGTSVCVFPPIACLEAYIYMVCDHHLLPPLLPTMLYDIYVYINLT